MLRLTAALTALALTALTGARNRWQAIGADAERGSVTLEQVIIALGLFLLAIAAVAGITAAVNGRLAQIT